MLKTNSNSLRLDCLPIAQLFVLLLASIHQVIIKCCYCITLLLFSSTWHSWNFLSRSLVRRHQPLLPRCKLQVIISKHVSSRLNPSSGDIMGYCSSTIIWHFFSSQVTQIKRRPIKRATLKNRRTRDFWLLRCSFP